MYEVHEAFEAQREEFKKYSSILKKARGQVQVRGGEDTIKRHGNTRKFD